MVIRWISLNVDLAGKHIKLLKQMLRINFKNRRSISNGYHMRILGQV